MSRTLSPSALMRSPVVDLFRSSGSTLMFDRECSLSGEELAEASERSGQWLLQRGLTPGDRVALWMQNSRGYIQSFLACASSGLVAVSVNTRYSTSEVTRLLERTGARVVITDQSSEPLGPPVQTIQVKDLLSSNADEIATGHDLVPGPSQSEVSVAGERCVVFTTSGSTGEPKMVVHRQASIATHSMDIAKRCGFSPTDVALVAMPLCGTFGLSSLLGSIAAGCRTVLVPDRFDVEDTASLIAEHRVSVLNGSDDMFHRLLASSADLTSVRVGGYARFNTSLDGIVERASERGMYLTGLYGMSEVQALFTIRDIRASPTARSQAGGTLTSSGAGYRIVDGELQLKGPSLFEGYLAEGGVEIDQVLTAAAMDGEWFKTGDSAEQSSLDDERTFTFISRLGDVLRIGGFLVAPTEIEQALLSFSQAADGSGSGLEIVGAQVVAVDRPNGVRPVAFVVCNPPDETLDEAAIKDHCATDLARFKVPIRVFPLAAFPMVDGPNGLKVRRDELRRLAERRLLERPSD